MFEGLCGTDSTKVWNFWMDNWHVLVGAGFRWAVGGKWDICAPPWTWAKGVEAAAQAECQAGGVMEEVYFLISTSSSLPWATLNHPF